MDADWYVDPLERYEGRFFNGAQWTDQVSDGGVLSRDPDFAPEIGSDVERDVDPTTDAIDAIDEFGGGTEQPAVATVDSGEPRRASAIEESPTRVVAVLDESIVVRRRAAPTGNDERPHESNGRSGRVGLVAALLALVAALALLGFLFLRDSDRSVDSQAETVALDSAQEERVEDLEEGGTNLAGETDPAESLQVDVPQGAVAPDAVFADAEAVQVGSLTIANGASLLADLAAWHQGFAAQRGIDLGPDSGCWFGELGGAAVQVAQCGPVGGSAATEFLFDLVPLQLEDRAEALVAQPVVDDVTTDAVLSNALVLVGAQAGPAPPLSVQGATRGERETTTTNKADAESDD